MQSLTHATCTALAVLTQQKSIHCDVLLLLQFAGLRRAQKYLISTDRPSPRSTKPHFNLPAFAVLANTSFQFSGLRRPQKNLILTRRPSLCSKTNLPAFTVLKNLLSTRWPSPCSKKNFNNNFLNTCAAAVPINIFLSRPLMAPTFCRILYPGLPLGAARRSPLELLFSRLATTTISCHQLFFLNANLFFLNCNWQLHHFSGNTILLLHLLQQNSQAAAEKS